MIKAKADNENILLTPDTLKIILDELFIELGFTKKASFRTPSPTGGSSSRKSKILDSLNK